ncbi:anti-sigma factor [Arthrobacter sp. CJ23]|uniref:anti-sigma factor n=1 Tax=Arthrobacter sp. CJ23 TaxID=2972479 RepID=UPI00215C09C8|nr:anti-sigma factor [Arthrobacter sp. CJ23]UVJ38359.1 anti-sigma factor [Arthrobacter sp. CJ23]
MSEDNAGGFVRRMFAMDIPTDLAEGRLLELAEIYALDALSNAERTAIDDFVRNSPDGPAFLARVRDTRETLAVSYTAEEEPPAGLLQNILDRLPDNSAAQAAPGPRAETARLGPAPDNAAVVDAAQDSRVADFAAARNRRDERRRGSLRSWLVGVAAAAVIALGGVGVGAYVAAQNDPVNQVLQAQDVRQSTVDVTGGGTATVSISSAKDAVVVRMNGVPAPPAGKVYQMWLIPKDGSAPVSQGLMDAQALTHPAVVKGISGAAALGITVEPAGGSPSPSLPTVAAATLSS